MYLQQRQLNSLQKSSLFAGITTNDIDNYLKEINIYPKKISAGSHIVEQGDMRSGIHIVLSGFAVGEKISRDGTAVTVNEFRSGGVFGDMLSGAEEKSPVSVTMREDGEIMIIPFASLLSVGESCRETREKVLRNLIGEIASKYFSLLHRLDVILCPSLRGKIAAYLLSFGTEDSFTVPHSRQEQAGLLNCDRSALSRELSRMDNEGIIYFRGREFHILNREMLSALAQ